MGMTDPIADLLTRLRNGARARKTQVDAPWSRIKERLVAAPEDILPPVAEEKAAEPQP